MLNHLDLPNTPAFAITIAGAVSPIALNHRIIDLRLTDERGFAADQLDLTLDDSDQKLALPKRGAKITLAIGWHGQPLVNKGIFVVDEITHLGAPDKIIITARSADFRQDFNLRRERSWHDVLLGSVVSDIAANYALPAIVCPKLAQLEIDHADQIEESDISFLGRLAQRTGAVTTVKNGRLLFFTPGLARSASGQLLSDITITRASGDNYRFRVADRDTYSGVTAYWHDVTSGKKNAQHTAASKEKNSYLVGAVGNVLVLRQAFSSAKSAKQAANARWQQLQRGAAEFSIQLARGMPELFPECPIQLDGFKVGLDDSRWIASKVVHTINANGFTTLLECEAKIASKT